MSTDEVTKLEELFRMGFVLENEYKQRKEALAEEGIIASNDAKARPPLQTSTGIDLAELNNLPKIMHMLQSNDPRVCQTALEKCRKLSSIPTNPPLKQLYEAGIVPFLIKFLKEHGYPEVQYEAAWTLLNITSGVSELTKAVAASGAIPELMNIISTSTNVKQIEQCVWTMGNIAGDSVELRNYVLEQGFMKLVLQTLNTHRLLTLVRVAVWTVSNLLRGKPQPKFEQVKEAIPMLAYMINTTDEQVLGDTLWSLAFLSDGPDDRIQAIIDHKLLPRIVSHLQNSNIKICVPALRTVGNLATGNDQQTMILLQENVIPSLNHLLKSPKIGIVKETCWTFSNISAGTHEQIQLLCNEDVFRTIIEIANDETRRDDVRKEAGWVLSNGTSGANRAQVEYLMSLDVSRPLINHLRTSTDKNYSNMILDSIECILQVEENEELYKATIRGYGGIEVLQRIRATHQDAAARSKSSSLLSRFFPMDDCT